MELAMYERRCRSTPSHAAPIFSATRLNRVVADGGHDLQAVQVSALIGPRCELLVLH
jgi:hypothetical protein